MEEELDLWEYLRVILRRWPIVLAGLALTVAAMVAFWYLQPVRYQATATLLATAPRYEWRFDSSILPIVDTKKDWKAEFMDLARSYNVANGALRVVQDRLPGGQELTPAALKRALEAKAGPAGIFYLSVAWPTAEGAIELTNALADQLVEQARKLYGGGDELAQFEASMEEAGERLQKAAVALQEFQSETGMEVLRKGFEGLIGYSADERELDLLSDELGAHRAALASLTLMIEESRRILAEGGAPPAFPWQLAETPVIAARGLLTRTLPLSDPEAIIRAMEEEKKDVEAVTAELEQQVAGLQERQAQHIEELNRLTRERDLAEESYSILVRKVEELRARQIADVGSVRVVQRPVKAQPTRMKTSVALGLPVILGLLVGVVGALVADRLARAPKGAEAGGIDDEAGPPDAAA